MRLYAVVEGSSGAHEPDGVYSIWADRISAETEAQRLAEMAAYGSGKPDRSRYSGFSVVEVELNAASDSTIGSY